MQGLLVEVMLLIEAAGLFSCVFYMLDQLVALGTFVALPIACITPTARTECRALLCLYLLALVRGDVAFGMKVFVLDKFSNLLLQQQE